MKKKKIICLESTLGSEIDPVTKLPIVSFMILYHANRINIISLDGVKFTLRLVCCPNKLAIVLFEDNKLSFFTWSLIDICFFPPNVSFPIFMQFLRISF